MEVQTAVVTHRITELRRLARSLRDERRRSRTARLGRLRVALGRRLVTLGIALLDGGRPRRAAPIR